MALGDPNPTYAITNSPEIPWLIKPARSPEDEQLTVPRCTVRSSYGAVLHGGERGPGGPGGAWGKASDGAVLGSARGEAGDGVVQGGAREEAGDGAVGGVGGGAWRRRCGRQRERGLG